MKKKNYTKAMSKVIKRIKKSDKPISPDLFAVLLEAIQSDFRVFGEMLDFMNRRLNITDAKLNVMDGKLDATELGLGVKIDRLAEDVEYIKNDIIEIKLDITDMKKELKQKVDLGQLKAAIAKK